jgi:hypothetical protein
MSLICSRKRYAPNIGATDVLNISHPGPFNYHLGDIFTPGADAWAFDMPTPGLLLQSVYGRGGVASVCCRKFTFDFRAQQAGNVPTVTLQNPANGGVLVGTFGVTSLISRQNAML